MQIEVNNVVTVEKDELIAGVRRYNDAMAGPANTMPLTVLARADDGRLMGGVSGRTVYWHFLIEVLWVDEQYRGQDLGRTLMERAEHVARTRGCVAAQVDTLSFQAPGFYRKLGFEAIGTIDDFPAGFQRYFLLKRYG